MTGKHGYKSRWNCSSNLAVYPIHIRQDVSDVLEVFTNTSTQQTMHRQVSVISHHNCNRVKMGLWSELFGSPRAHSTPASIASFTFSAVAVGMLSWHMVQLLSAVTTRNHYFPLTLTITSKESATVYATRIQLLFLPLKVGSSKSPVPGQPISLVAFIYEGQ